MKTFLIATFILFTSLSSSFSDTYVRGYYKNNGTYVAPHYRSNSNNTKSDNWSQRGNTNPYTGKRGTRDCGYNCTNQRRYKY